MSRLLVVHQIGRRFEKPTLVKSDERSGAHFVHPREALNLQLLRSNRRE